MNPLEPKTSSRLRRAAVAERQQLEGKRARIDAIRAQLVAELRQAELQLLAVDERLEILERLAGPTEESLPSKNHSGSVSASGKQVLRGTAIRETAARILAGHPEGRAPIPYRRLYGFLEDEGYAVAGKDPLAVFLTQISRSPAIERTSHAGVYRLDFDAPERLRRRLMALHSELRTEPSAPSDRPADLAEVRERRDRLHGEIRKHERELDEVMRVFAPTDNVAAEA